MLIKNNNTILKKSNIIIALYEPEIPQNVGTIMRTCDCFNLKLILIEPLGFIFQDKNFKRSKMDYSPDYELIPSFFNFYEKYKNNRIIILTPHTTNDINNFKFNDNDILLFGRESNGIEIEIAQYASFLLRIPISGRSLNLAVSVAITLSFI